MSGQVVPKILISTALAYGLWLTAKCPCPVILNCHMKEIMFVFLYCTGVLIYYNGFGEFVRLLLLPPSGS
jgi:hypothetical protein